MSRGAAGISEVTLLEEPVSKNGKKKKKTEKLSCPVTAGPWAG